MALTLHFFVLSTYKNRKIIIVAVNLHNSKCSFCTMIVCKHALVLDLENIFFKPAAYIL